MSGEEKDSLSPAEDQAPEDQAAEAKAPETSELNAEPKRRERPIELTEYQRPDVFDWSEFPAYCREKRLSDNDRKLASALEKATNIKIRELWNGLAIEASSYVGHVRFDGFDLVVRPKILSLRGSDEESEKRENRAALLTLLTYAFRLPDIKWLGKHTAREEVFEDLLIHLLLQAVGKIAPSGYFQEYNRRRRDLDVLRGRFDQKRWIQRGGVPSPLIPCEYHAKNADNVLNQTLLAGLRRASALARFPSLGAQSRVKASEIAALNVTEKTLSRTLLGEAKRKLNRLNSRYRDALTIISLLHEGSGGFLQGSAISQPLVIPGFFFDMNLLFEAAVARFLQENLPGQYKVDAQRKVFQAFRGNPTREMRPDIWIEEGDKRYIYDTKYKIYDNEKWIDMSDLYQLSIYALALSDEGKDQNQKALRHATILYPTEAPSSQRVKTTTLWRYGGSSSSDPLCGITIRGINMREFCKLIRDRGSDSGVKRRELALELIEPKETLS